MDDGTEDRRQRLASLAKPIDPAAAERLLAMRHIGVSGKCVVCRHKPRSFKAQQRMMRRNKGAAACYDTCHEGAPVPASHGSFTFDGTLDPAVFRFDSPGNRRWITLILPDETAIDAEITGVDLEHGSVSFITK